MSSIGSLTFLKMEGPQIPQLATAVELLDRKGMDGTAKRDNALKAPEITKYTQMSVSLLADAANAANVYAALKGTYVTVVDDLPSTAYLVLVIDVRVTSVKKMGLSDPTGINYIINAVWSLKPTV